MGLVWSGLSILFLCSAAFAYPDHYSVLELKDGKGSSPDQIRRAHRRLVLRYHPDRNPGDVKAEEKFKAVQFAYEVLSDPARRNRYDQGLPDTPKVSDSDDGNRPRRPESGFYDPTGIGRLNNARINSLHDNYLEFRQTMSPIEAVTKALVQERGTRRPRMFGDEVYESQTQHVFGEFLDEVLDDVLMTYHDRTPPMGSAGSDALATRSERNEVSLQRRPRVDEIVEITQIVYGKDGGGWIAQRALTAARTASDLSDLLHLTMRLGYYDILSFPDRPDVLHRSRKRLVTAIEPALQRVHPIDLRIINPIF